MKLSYILSGFICKSALLLCLLSSCDKIAKAYDTRTSGAEVAEKRVHYAECNRLNDIIYRDGNPFTGKVWAEDERSYLEVQDGHQIAVIGLYVNGGIAFKMEFYSPDERHLSSYSKEGKLLYKQRIYKGFRHRPDIWDFNGNKLEYENINTSPSVQPIINYNKQNVTPIVDNAQSAYQNQLNKASY